MEKSDVALKNCIKSLNKTMNDCRTEIRNRAMLQNVMSFSFMTENKTGWSAKYFMLKRFNNNYAQLRNVAENEKRNIAIGVTLQFKSAT